MQQIQLRRFISKKRKNVFFLLILTAILFFPDDFYAIENPLFRYLNQKSLSNYEKALEIIEEWSVREKDPIIIETNIFRIYELIKYPELIERAIRAYNDILKNETVQNNQLITARINIFLNILYLRKGSMREASLIRESLGFISKYKISGPFKNGDFNQPFLPEEELSTDDSEKTSYKTRNSEWFNAQVDLTGKLDVTDLLGHVSNSVFYFKSSFSVPADGKYILWLGKTGYTDIWVDGNNVYSNREKHGFSFDQYGLLLSLSGGKHIVLIKTGDSNIGLKFALRLTDEGGRAVDNVQTESGGRTASVAKCALENIFFFYSLEKIIKIKPMDRQAVFNTGYLYFISGLNSEGDGESKILFSKLKESGLSSSSNFYLGLLERGGEKESCFNKSFGAYKGNVEAIYEIADIKLQKKLPFDAYTLIELIRKINPQSFYINKLKARALLSRSWLNEALKESYPPKNLIKSVGYEIEADIYLKIGKYKEALKAYKLLYEIDRYNMDYLNNLLECYIKTGKYDEALGLLNQCAEYYPNNAILRLKHAKLIENTRGPGDALPYLLYARKISPYNKDVLLQTGLVYHKLDKKELALQYLKSALMFDPKNKWIAGYIEYLKRPLTKPGLRNERLPGSTGKASHVDLGSLESEIFKSYFSGNEVELYDNIEKFLSVFPAKPESILYYREIGKLGRIVGYERTAQTLNRLINSVNGIISLEKKNLYILSLKLELEKLLYCYNIHEAKKQSEEFFSIRRWSLLGPYFKYGPADIDYPFMPEIITNIKNSDIKKKELYIQNAKGELDFSKYFYPENGIAYAVATIACNQPVKIRIYSDSSYKLFLNGKEAIRNFKSEIFRTCRIVKVRDSARITLMIKCYMKEKNNNLRVLITDENDKLLKINADKPEIVFSDINFFEEMDYPYSYFTALNSSATHNEKNYVNFKLGRYFHELGSREAVKYYRKAIKADSEDPVKFFYLAECLLDLSNGDKKSVMYLEGMKIINDLTPRPPLLKNGEGGDSPFSFREKGVRGMRSQLDYANFFLNTGYEKEFEKEINLLKSRFPQATEPLNLLAAYYKNRDVFKSIEINKMILASEISGATLTDLINIYKQQGRYKDIKSLIELYDTEGHFRKELIQALMDSEDYDNAKKVIFQGLAEKNDPYFNIKLGEINYIQGFDPVMYLQKALSQNPSDNSLRDYLNYLETGKFNNTAFKNIESSGFEINIKDIKDFVFWYKGFLQGAFDIEIDRINLNLTHRTPDEQIKSVYEYIARNIKLKGSGLFTPEKAMDTLYKKRGTAEDKTILALSILAELGIKSYIAFVGQSDFLNASDFSPEIFSSILLYVPLDVKTGLWMDFSNARYDYGVISDDHAGKDAVVIIKDGYEIKRITGNKE